MMKANGYMSIDVSFTPGSAFTYIGIKCQSALLLGQQAVYHRTIHVCAHFLLSNDNTWSISLGN